MKQFLFFKTELIRVYKWKINYLHINYQATLYWKIAMEFKNLIVIHREIKYKCNYKKVKRID